ncbi:MAG TPA: hypothetical protein DD635_01900 [Flavobacteriales bacterium]|nr:hypothetical protein [Flavobacteriales bacterium]|tara:strand:- start:1523 stop:2281 length:759 start_codon:yes stop_codon:yes gene_type:complete
MWLAGLILLIISLVGAGAYDYFGAKLKAHLSLILTFGGAFLIGIIFNHLIPETYAMGTHVGWIVVLGFLLQGVLEYGSQGIEHGHLHSSEGKDSFRIPWAAFGSLCLHALIESMPLQGHDRGHDHHGQLHLHGIEGVDMTLLVGLILHKLPVALVLMGMMDALGIKRSSRWLAIVVFGLMPLTGMLLYDVMVHAGASWSKDVPAWTGGLLIGILLHISTTILFEANDGHHFNRNKLLVTIAGLALAVFTTGI